jgi:hypothetical protein
MRRSRDRGTWMLAGPEYRQITCCADAVREYTGDGLQQCMGSHRRRLWLMYTPKFSTSSQCQHAHIVVIKPFNCTDRLQSCPRIGKVTMGRASTYIFIPTKLSRQQETSSNRTSQRLIIQHVPPYASIICEGTHIGFQATTVYP